MGEKYDGIRCCWNPTLGAAYLTLVLDYNFSFICFDSSSYTRNGREILLLPQMEQCIPSLFIDGEFWYISCTLRLLITSYAILLLMQVWEGKF